MLIEYIHTLTIVWTENNMRGVGGPFGHPANLQELSDELKRRREEM